MHICTVPELKSESGLHRLIGYISSGQIFISCQDTAIWPLATLRNFYFFSICKFVGIWTECHRSPLLALAAKPRLKSLLRISQYMFNKISIERFPIINIHKTLIHFIHTYTETIVQHCFWFTLLCSIDFLFNLTTDHI